MTIRRLLLIASALLLPACSTKIPQCPTPEPGPEVRSAGCLVINDNRLLVIREMSGKVSIPGGGGDSGETGRCTAFRETWEETGLTVRAGKLIRQFDNGFHLYRCTLMGSAITDPEFTHEVREAFWLDHRSFDQHSWRFPDQKVWLQGFLATPQQTP